jgi:hypothetical protein
MGAKLTRWFIVSAGALLAFTGVAKLVSSGGGPRALQTIDPIIGLPFGQLFFVVGLAELITDHFCFALQDVARRAAMVAWLSTSFLVYRIGLVWLGYHKPCGCLGTFTEAIHLSPQTADTIMKVVLGYLLVGSYACLWWCWRRASVGVRPAGRGDQRSGSGERGLSAGEATG